MLIICFHLISIKWRVRFLWDDLYQDLWSKIARIMKHLRCRRILVQIALNIYKHHGNENIYRPSLYLRVGMAPSAGNWWMRQVTTGQSLIGWTSYARCRDQQQSLIATEGQCIRPAVRRGGLNSLLSLKLWRGVHSCTSRIFSRFSSLLRGFL